MSSQEVQKSNKLSDEIDVMDIFRPIWFKKKFILKVSFLFAVVGLLISFISEKTFVSEVAFIPQSSSDTGGLGGQLGGLANLAGFELGSENSGDEFPPSLYPKLLENVDFQMKVLESQLYLSDWEDSLSYKDYYLQKYKPSLISRIGDYTLGLPFKLIDAIKGKPEAELASSTSMQPFKRLSKLEKELLGTFFSQVSVNPDREQGYVTVSMSMSDPFLAAQMTNHVRKLINDYLVDYKTQKAQQELNFIENNFREKKSEFQIAQNKLSVFKDRNLGLSTVSAQNELRLLEGEYDIALQVYTNLATKLEEAKLNLSKNTPLLTIIKPVTVPLKRSGPRTVFNTVLAGLIGVMIALFLVFLPLLKEKLETAINNEES